MNDTERIVADYVNHDLAYNKAPSVPEMYADVQAARRYVEKYWLEYTKYREVWKPLQDMIFIENALPEQRVFKDGFDMIPIRGGHLFGEEEFNNFSTLLSDLQETAFMIIQTRNDVTKDTPLMRFCYPWPVNWSEISGGNYLSEIMLGAMYNDYIMVGRNGKWGRYTCNDAVVLPWDLYFCKPELTPIFKKHLVPPDEDMEDLLSWLTEEYRELALKSGIRPVIGG